MKRRMLIRSAYFAATLFLTLSASAQSLPTDPAVVTGKLDNGLTYMVRKHATPPGRAALWMHLHTGSLNETDRQRGIAHYLEHMAFNGSTNFPPGTVVPFFQSLGMTFGRDQNAFTNMEQTTYQLSLPNTAPESLDKGMTFFADILSRLTLQPKEIDAERQIIQEERRRGLSGRQRTSDYVFERIAPGSVYSQRDTIGTEQTIDGVNEADFRDYYGKWYAASNATLMVVADAEPAEIVKRIQEKFGDAPTRPRPTPQPSGVKAYERSFAIVTSDAEIRAEEIRIVRLEPARPPTTTVPQFRDELVLQLGLSALNTRISDKVSRGGTSYLSARLSAGNESDAIYTAEVTARPNPGKWKAALEEVALDVQRARLFGLTERELSDAGKQTLAFAERSVETESTQTAQVMLGRMNRSVGEREPLMSAQQRLELLKQMIPSIKLDEVNKRIAEEYEPKAVAFIAVLPAGDGVPSEADLLEIGTHAFQAKPTREAEVAHATQLMSELPAGGKVVDGSEHTATKVWSGWLGNNVRVHHRFMDEQKNDVSVSIALIGGEMLESAENRGVTSAAQIAFSRPATKNLTSSDIRELMTGKKVNVGGGGFGGRGGGRRGGGGGGAADAITLSISGSPDELETGFQLAHLLLTQPKIESAAFTQMQTSTREMLQESLKNPMMLGMRTAMAAPYPTDEPRMQPLTIEQVDQLTLDAAQSWLERLIANSPIEVTIVGDLPQARALELAARYLGSLPTREKVSTESYAGLRRIKRPTGPITIDKTLDTPTAQAFVLSGFYGADETNIADTRALNIASRILSTRMTKEVREEAQLVYSIGASSRAASTYPGFGVFSAAAPTEPHKVKALVEKLASMYDAFAASGPTADEMEVAKKQMANTVEEQMREPAFWAGAIGKLTFRGANLDDTAAVAAAYQALTADQVQKAFAKYAAPKNRIVVTVRPTE